eukprot:scaffold3876_cov344-Prasinococcus_capsulatus_cf.AAC.3
MNLGRHHAWCRCCETGRTSRQFSNAPHADRCRGFFCLLQVPARILPVMDQSLRRCTAGRAPKLLTGLLRKFRIADPLRKLIVSVDKHKQPDRRRHAHTVISGH